LQDLYVLARLRHHAVVECHHQQYGVDATGPGKHGVDEALVSGNIHEAERVSVGIAEVDGDAAALFLGQPIGVDPGERFHQGGLAVVDMTGGAYDHAGIEGSVIGAVQVLWTVIHVIGDVGPGH